MIHDKKGVNMWALFLDDERMPPSNFNGELVVARSLQEAIDLIVKNGCPYYISFDHDLGGDLTGMQLVKWIIEKDLDENGGFIPKNFSFFVHSANPVGGKNIQTLLSSYLEWRKGS